MKSIAFLLNLPWTILGFLAGLMSIPEKISWNRTSWALVIKVKSFWWCEWGPFNKFVGAQTIGNVVLLKSLCGKNILEHEFVHVKQFERLPFIFPFLCTIESIRKGYWNNKYEEEAYAATDSISLPFEWSYGEDDLADRLKALTLSGQKTATTGFYRVGKVFPKPGQYEGILDRSGKRFCIIECKRIEVKPFLEVDWKFAKLEGEDSNLEEWRQGHRDYFRKYYPEFSDTSLVVCEEFEVVKVLDSDTSFEPRA